MSRYVQPVKTVNRWSVFTEEERNDYAEKERRLIMFKHIPDLIDFWHIKKKAFIRRLGYLESDKP